MDATALVETAWLAASHAGTENAREAGFQHILQHLIRIEESRIAWSTMKAPPPPPKWAAEVVEGDANAKPQ